MRILLLALLVAGSGCNWAFGLDATQLRDGGGDDSPDAPPAIRDKLLFAIAATNTTTGAPIAPIYVPIGSEATHSMVPTIMVGEPLGGMPLTTADYDVSDGSFAIPYTLREAPHRIVYTLPNETVQHEVQWSISGATMIVPRLTRVNAPAIPPGSGFSITPTGQIGSLSSPAIATTGVFSYDNRLSKFTTSNSTTTYNFAANAQLLTTPSGAPQGTLQDFVILGELGIGATSSQSSFAGFAITHLDLMSGAPSTPTTQPTWNTANCAVASPPAPCRTMKTSAGCGPDDCIPNTDDITYAGRMNMLGALTGTKSRLMMYGIAPTTKLPGFVPGAAPDYVEQPAIIPFLTSTTLDGTLTLADPMKPPTPQLPFERVLFARMSGTRTVNGATLTSSIQVVTTKFVQNTSLVVDAPLALQIKLGTNIDLSSGDNTMIDASSQATTLAWTDETANGTNYVANDYVVTLYEITNNRLAPQRIYHVLTHSVLIDGSLLTSGHDYVFAITSRSGFSQAKQGNYGADTVTYPFSEATTFAGSIHVR